MACLLASGLWLEQDGGRVWFIGPLGMLSCVLALYLLPKHYVIAHLIWQAGLAGAITLAMFMLGRPEIAFAYTLLPMAAVVTLGWPAGLIAGVGIAAWVWWLSLGASTPLLSATQGIVIALVGGVSGLLGWASMRTFLTVTEWSLYRTEMAQKKTQEALDQRVEFKQIQADLIQANRELARLSDRLNTMQQLAQEARRAKEEFVANVSHELRTPLNMIIGFSEMLLQSSHVYGITLPPQVLADVAAIERNSRHLSGLVDDVLDLSQVEAGRMALSKDWIALPEIVDAAVAAVRALFESKGLFLDKEIPANLPPLYCDEMRIRQVMINLLSNAGRFTERGGVTVEAWLQADQVVVSVADTGPGIPPEDLDKLFEPFQQLDGSIRRRHGGSGLGLSISKQFIEMHGGRMWLESRLDAGTTLYFSLPSQSSPGADLDTDQVMRWFSPYDEYDYRAPNRRSRAPALNVSPRLVVLEEGNTLQRLLSRYLDGVELVAVQEKEKAIQELSRSPAQALIINTPLSETLHSPLDDLGPLPYGTPAMTCWVPGEDEAARRLGVVRYLIKPVTRKLLQSALESLGAGIKNVLLVDDEREALQLFSRMLSSAESGYRILRAQNGQQAMDLMRERRPDVVLLDLIMPGMDGFQVLKAKSRDPSIRDIPVVIVSSRDPSNEPIVSNMLSVMRGDGLSVGDLLHCIQAISETLTPSIRSADREHPKTLAV